MKNETNNIFQIADLKFPVFGEMHAYIHDGTVEWVVNVISDNDPDSDDFPFSANLSAEPFHDLKKFGFDLSQCEFFYNISKSYDFAFNAQGGTFSSIVISKLEFSKSGSEPLGCMRLKFKDVLNLNILPGYMDRLYCSLCVDVKFTHFTYENSKSIESDIDDIRRITGAQSPIKLLMNYGDGVARYTIAY